MLAAAGGDSCRMEDTSNRIAQLFIAFATGTTLSGFQSEDSEGKGEL